MSFLRFRTIKKCSVKKISCTQISVFNFSDLMEGYHNILDTFTDRQRKEKIRESKVRI